MFDNKTSPWYTFPRPKPHLSQGETAMKTPLDPWMLDHVRRDHDGFVFNRYLYANYVSWCYRHQATPTKPVHFGRILVQKGLQPARLKGQRGFYGIKLVEEGYRA